MRDIGMVDSRGVLAGWQVDVDEPGGGGVLVGVGGHVGRVHAVGVEGDGWCAVVVRVVGLYRLHVAVGGDVGVVRHGGVRVLGWGYGVAGGWLHGHGARGQLALGGLEGQHLENTKM